MSRDAPETIHGAGALSGPPHDARHPADVAYRRAFLSLLLFPVSFAAAFLVGEGLFSLLAADPDDPALWSVLVAGVPAIAVFAIPAGFAWALGQRARRLGRPDGRTPALVGIVIVAAFVGTNLFNFVVGLILD